MIEPFSDILPILIGLHNLVVTLYLFPYVHARRCVVYERGSQRHKVHNFVGLACR